MAIKLPQGFKIGSIEPIDTRLTLTKAEMFSINENTIPNNYLCICKDDGKFYLFNKTFEKLEEIGKFRLYEDIIDMVKAITTTMSDPESAQQLANALFDSDQFKVSTDKRIKLKISEIQAIDGN